jgi:DNA-binding GntR family transcriptional regulator
LARQARPRYIEIAEDLRRQLERAQANDPMPSEADLSLQFGVSRMTARQAVKLLEGEGLLYRVPGSGTFATGRSAHRNVAELRSFTEEMRLRGISVTSQVIDLSRSVPRPQVRADLALADGIAVIHVERVRLGDGRPLALESVHLHPRASFVLDFDLSERSIHALLESRGLVPSEASGTVVAEAADERVSKLLSVQVGEPLLVERRRIVDQHDAPLESTETKYVGNRYVFDVHLQRARSAATSLSSSNPR